MAKGRRTATTVEEQARERQTAAPVTAPPEDGREILWSIALLRVAMELKRPDAPGLEEIIDGVVARMGVPRAEFQRFLADNLGLLTETAREKGYAR